MSTSKSNSWPLLLIALAITGAGISYHFTLDSRFAALEQKLRVNAEPFAGPTATNRIIEALGSIETRRAVPPRRWSVVVPAMRSDPASLNGERTWEAQSFSRARRCPRP